ncbi:MAG: NFACT RNA binding domain-containing protein [Eubacteriales bacterium]|nr:NFACT RNA binding domain-containing protein [Eubacteriales bacterium]
MPMDGFTLSYLQQELSVKLTGGRVDKVNQPERDALLLLIRNSGGNHKLLLSANANQARAQLTAQVYENPTEPPMFCMLMRKHLLGSRVLSVKQLYGDRILAIAFDAIDELNDHVEKTLYLEIMGRYSDLTLVNQQGIIIDAIRHVNSEMSRVRTLLPGDEYVLPPRQDKLTPEELTAPALEERLRGLTMPLSKALMECVSGMAGLCSKEVCAQLGLEPSVPVSELDPERTAQRLSDFFLHAPQRANPVTLYDQAGLAVDFFPFPYRSFDPDHQKPMPSLSEAMDAFYLGRDLRLRMQQKSIGLQRHIKSALERTEKKKGIMLATLQSSEQAEQNRIYGDLLTANMHLISRGQASIAVQNYYDENAAEVEIPLNTRLAPAQNAQAYYKKYRKAKVAEQYATEQLKQIEKDLLVLESGLDDLEKCESSADMAEIRYVLIQSGFLRPDAAQRKQKKLVEGKPYRFTAPDGTVIEVGKNSMQNDRLTLHARGGETWLHVQGIPGSHVIIRSEEPPKDDTLLFAAKLAAYYSRGRNHPSMPVDYTLRKYVKKSANAPAGLVTYTNFQTLFVGVTPEDQALILKQANQ